MNHHNPPAFPRPLSHDAVYRADECLRQGDSIDFQQAQQGMTLRDYFAAAAISGLAARSYGNLSSEAMAKQAFAIADFMLANR
jgi:hypothetical protein